MGVWVFGFLWGFFPSFFVVVVFLVFGDFFERYMHKAYILFPDGDSKV